MTSAQLIATLVYLAATVGCALVVMFRRPSEEDRWIGMGMLWAALIAGSATLSFVTGSAIGIDLALGLAATGLIATLVRNRRMQSGYGWRTR